MSIVKLESAILLTNLVLFVFCATEEDVQVPSLLSKEPVVRSNWDDEDADDNEVKDSWEDDDEPAPPVRLIA